MMNTSITTWLLAGALAASLAWNAKGWVCRPAAPALQQCASAPDLSKLNLSAEQRRALEAWCLNSCEPSCRMDSEAEVRVSELHAALRNPAAPPDSLRALAAEINRLRAHSLEACIGSILEVRRLLTKEQLDALIGCCNSQPQSNTDELRSLGYSNKK